MGNRSTAHGGNESRVAMSGNADVCIGSALRREIDLVALLVLLLILAIFGGLGFAAHFLWILLIAALILWVIGFFIGGVESGLGRRRWYGRW